MASDDGGVAGGWGGCGREAGTGNTASSWAFCCSHTRPRHIPPFARLPGPPPPHASFPPRPRHQPNESLWLRELNAKKKLVHSSLLPCSCPPPWPTPPHACPPPVVTSQIRPIVVLKEPKRWKVEPVHPCCSHAALCCPTHHLPPLPASCSPRPISPPCPPPWPS